MALLSGASAQTNRYTEGTWDVHINDLNCTGEEEAIWDCPQNGLSRYSCNHYQDASVICQCKFTRFLKLICNISLNTKKLNK